MLEEELFGPGVGCGDASECLSSGGTASSLQSQAFWEMRQKKSVGMLWGGEWCELSGPGMMLLGMSSSCVGVMCRGTLTLSHPRRETTLGWDCVSLTDTCKSLALNGSRLFHLLGFFVCRPALSKGRGAQGLHE